MEQLKNEDQKQATDSQSSPSPRRWKTYVGLVLLFLVTFVSVGYALTTLTINNTGTVIIANKNWQGITFSPSATGFPATASDCPSNGYTDTPSPIVYGSLAQGTQSIGAVCVKNVSTGSQTYNAQTAAGATLPSGTTVTYSADGGTATSASIAPGGISLLDITVAASSTSGSGAFNFNTQVA